MQSISELLHETKGHISELQTILQESAGLVPRWLAEKIVADAKQLNRMMHKQQTIMHSVDKKLESDLLSSISKLKSSPAFIQALGDFQHNFILALDRIETVITKELPRVKKVEGGRA